MKKVIVLILVEIPILLLISYFFITALFHETFSWHSWLFGAMAGALIIKSAIMLALKEIKE